MSSLDQASCYHDLTLTSSRHCVCVPNHPSANRQKMSADSQHSVAVLGSEKTHAQLEVSPPDALPATAFRHLPTRGRAPTSEEPSSPGIDSTRYAECHRAVCNWSQATAWQDSRSLRVAALGRELPAGRTGDVLHAATSEGPQVQNRFCSQVRTLLLPLT